MNLQNNLNSDTMWDIYETEYRPDQAVTTGSNYMIGNGYLGYRGTFSDDRAEDFVGCVVTDTYDNADGVWKELVTAPNGLYLEIHPDGDPQWWTAGKRSGYRRSLNFRYGEWSAEATWKDRGIALREERFASHDDIHLLVSKTTITAHRRQNIKVLSGIDGTVWSLNGDHFASRDAHSDGDRLEITGVTGEHGYDVLVMETARLHFGDGMEVSSHRASVVEPGARDRRGDAPVNAGASVYEGPLAIREFVLELEPGQTVTLYKYAVVYTTNDLRTAPNPHTRVSVPRDPALTGTIDPARSAAHARAQAPPVDDPERPSREMVRRAATDALERAVAKGWDTLQKESRAVWDRRWQTMDIAIAGDDLAQTILRYNLYHNIIATPSHTDHLPISARGLSCQAYQGAAFWDQEIFNLPMFLFTAPEIARNILMYRYHTLDGARRKARDLGYRGAFYAWISGDSGEEICPAYFFRDLVSGRRIRNHFNDWQIHISFDVAYTVQRYVTVTHDEEYLLHFGAEIVMEVARFIVSRVHYRLDRDRYDIIRVLGPDEYHENVDNNFFTNFQARHVISYAVEMVDWMTQNHPDEFAAVERKLSLDGAEVDQWRDVAAKLYVPEPDPASGLIEQFAGFFEHEDITPAELKARLIDPGEYWGWPNGIAFETQVSKQADVTQLFVLHPTAYDRTIMRANWEYYEPRTQHGSSLSPAVYAIVAAWVGHMDEATRYFLKSCTVDLYNDNKAISGGTFIGGIHTAACGISWQIIVLGFAGMYLTEDGFGFAPHIPEAWQQLSFSLTRWGRTVRVIVVRTQRTEGTERVASAKHAAEVNRTAGKEHAAGTTGIASEGSPYRLEVRAHQENGSSLGISWGAQHVAIAPGDSAILGA